MMTFQTGAPVKEMCDNIYQGSGMQNTWCMRWNLKPDASIHPVDMKSEAIWCKTEAI